MVESHGREIGCSPRVLWVRSHINRVANATVNFEEGQEGKDPPQEPNRRRSDRFLSKPKHGYSELITEPNEEEEGSVEITMNHIEEETQRHRSHCFLNLPPRRY